MTTASLHSWVKRAWRQPVAFAQVREDPALDLALLELLGDSLEVVMIASGGCTAAALVASERVARLHLVDANPAQMALARLKLWLLERVEVGERWQWTQSWRARS